jgi:DNA-binding winged helix-turn-helix (wHTH) protein
VEVGLSNRVRLGAFEFDLKAGELRSGDRKVRLQEQPFQILLMLMDRAGGLVTREEIQKKLWPNDTVVEFDHSIHTAIKKLRQALGDSCGDSTAETGNIHKQGWSSILRTSCMARPHAEEILRKARFSNWI